MAATLSVHLFFINQLPKFLKPTTHIPIPCHVIKPRSQTRIQSSQEDPFQTKRFLTAEDLISLKKLESFHHHTELSSGGQLRVRVMRPQETDLTVALLAESFADSITIFSALSGYVTLLGILVKQYLIERRSLMPHTATLLGFYTENGNDKLVLSGTVEVCFDRIGMSDSLPTPTPPKDSPYVCNMSVKKSIRRQTIGLVFYGEHPLTADYILCLRRGIGWHLLKASEQLISQMSSSREVYLHCRMIDTAPLSMYTKAGYSIVKTDSIFILLTLQRKKHLMRKELPVSESPSSDILDI